MRTSAEKGIQVRFEGNGPGCKQPFGNKICCQQVNKLLSSIRGPGHKCVLVSQQTDFIFSGSSVAQAEESKEWGPASASSGGSAVEK